VDIAVFTVSAFLSLQSSVQQEVAHRAIDSFLKMTLFRYLSASVIEAARKRTKTPTTFLSR
jgi:hypothetical protein